MHDSTRLNLRAYYDQEAAERDRREPQDWKIRQRERFLALLLQENKRTLLEVGAGTGRDSLFFQQQGLEPLCVDLSPGMAALCRAKGLPALVMDMAELDLPGRAFDAVYSMNSLLHLPKAEFPGVLRRVERLLNARGLFYLGMYGGVEREGVWENDPHEPRRFFSFYPDEQLQALAGALFDLHSFERVTLDPDDELHFQALILRKRG